MAADYDCEEHGSVGLPPAEVHKIAALDLRLGNTDRNGSNILVRRARGGDNGGTGDGNGAFELVPIDHAGIMPDSFEDLAFEWQFWPQASVPFEATTRAYIAALDAERDARALAAHGLAVRPECLRVMRVCTMLLQKGAATGLTAAQIAGIASRSALSAPSPLEKLHAAAVAAGGADGDGGAAYVSRMGRLVDGLIEELLLDNVSE